MNFSWKLFLTVTLVLTFLFLGQIEGAKYSDFVAKHVLVQTDRVNGQATPTTNDWCAHLKALALKLKDNNRVVNSFIVVPNGADAANDFSDPTRQVQRTAKGGPVWISASARTIYTVRTPKSGGCSVEKCSGAHYWAGLETQRPSRNPLAKRPNHFEALFDGTKRDDSQAFISKGVTLPPQPNCVRLPTNTPTAIP